MKAVCKKLFSLMLVAILLVSAVPFQVSADETDVGETTEAVVETTEAVVETQAAIAPIAETEANNEITTFAAPVTDPEVDNGIRYVEFQVTVDGKGLYRVGNLVKTKIGSTVGTPSEAAVMNVVKSVVGSSVGYKLIRWEHNNKTFTSATTINLDMVPSGTYTDEKTEETYDVIAIDAVIEYVAKEITLKPNGGTVAATKHTVVVGEKYGVIYEGKENEYKNPLPTPTKQHYTFAGWAKDDGNIVDNETVVTDLSSLTAKWNPLNKYTVVYKGYIGDWTEVGFGSFTVDANSVLKTAYNNFPTDTQIKDLFEKPLNEVAGKAAGFENDWKVAGWEYSTDGEKTWNTFTEGKTKITSNTVIRALFQKNVTMYACDSGWTTRNQLVTLGKRYPALAHPGTRDGYAFIGWYKSDAKPTAKYPTASGVEVSSKSDLANVAKHEYVEAQDQYLMACWEKAKTVYLNIYTDGNTKDPAKLVRYFDVPETGFSLSDIKLKDIFPTKYDKYNDSVDEQYGWYDDAQWANYLKGKHIYDTTEYVDADYFADQDAETPNEHIYEFHIMLIDNGNEPTNSNSYNDNKSNRDPSNPSTGDEIIVAMTVMAVSASALALFFLNKKRFAK